MSFDKATRNALAKLVSDCRRLLTADSRDQLQRVYGLQPDGTALPIGNLQHLDEQGLEIARELRIWQDHLTSTEHGADQRRRIAAFDRLAQETAFTALNRLAALRLCEERGHLLECVRRGKESDGFALYERLSGGALGTRGDTYRQFLQRVFDELAQDLGVLFDRRQPQSLVFPGERCLEEVLTLMNDPALRHLWQEDETIGWIYQYYNSQEERRQMREESAAPRNSRELAVRNQFFTPRYVVEFLTDNALGRIWYEMTKGSTFLKDKCRYLVRRPNELFLGPGEDPPTSNQEEQTSSRSQEELLKEPVHIPHRPLKDPREIRLLDPACGSMHFGLYAFDLFEVIYEEVWDKHTELLADLRRAITDKREFLIRVPKLIIEHNLHGIEIDARCTQIAGLSLWLRAQKTWQRLGLRMAERPRIARANIVCAEPMPGEKELLREFTARLESPGIGQLVEMVFDRMELAGEAGSLLKIEEEIKLIVAEAKALWKQGPKYEQAKLFAEHPARPEQQELKLDLSGITDEQFWEKAEELIYTALREYAEQAQNGGGYQRRLFAEDAARGFAFIDLSRKRFDVILMNPPFGDPTAALLTYLESSYPISKHDLAAAFIDRFLGIGLHGGKLGWISSRTWISSSLLESFRRELLYGSHRLSAVVDFGIGVLDSALVETAACTSTIGDSLSDNVVVFRLLASRDKESETLRKINKCDAMQVAFSKVLALPRAAFGYWFPQDFYSALSKTLPFDPALGTAKQGLATTDDFRFLRCLWEVHPQTVGWKHRWVPFAKGGEYEPYFDDIHLLIDWERNGSALKEYLVSQKGQAHWSRRISSSEFYGEAGLTYPERTTSDFSPRPLPAGTIFSATGQAVFLHTSEHLLPYLGLAYTRIFKQLIELFVGAGDASESGSAARHYTSGILSGMPIPHLNSKHNVYVSNLVRDLIKSRREELRGDEVTVDFLTTPLDTGKPTLAEALKAARDCYGKVCLGALDAAKRLEEWACSLYELPPKMAEDFLAAEVCPFPTDYPDTGQKNKTECAFKDVGDLVAQVCERHGFKRAFTKKGYWANRILELVSHYFMTHPSNCIAFDFAVLARHLESPVHDLMSYSIGAALGRWDIRYATHEKLAPELTDPFAPLPVCPPGMLQNAEGLPAAPAEVPANYPLRISWPGVLLDDPNHPEDIERRVREVIEAIWKERAETIEHEACEILRVKSLGEYFRKPAGFFADHLKRYSKSRRQAPIYWPLSTPSGSYTIWVYYHRLNEDLLYRVVNEYVGPKLFEVERRLGQVETDLDRATGREATRLRETFEETKSLIAELQDLKTELLRVAALPYKPNLNDGVLINAAPLWKLFRLPKWKNDLKECWEELDAGNFDWAHLAYTIWPERVQEKCKSDRSLAIAHGVETLCESRPKEESSGSSRKRKAKAAAPTES